MKPASTRTQLTLHNSVLDPLRPYIPERKSLTQFVEDLLEKAHPALDTSFRLDGATEPASGQPTLGRSPSKSSSSSNARALFAKEVPGNLFAHEELIAAYWKAKPRNKKEPAWKLLMSELTKIQEAHGDSVVREQLVLAEANRWQGITLANYERFGANKPNTATKASGIDYEALDAIRTPW